jgi:hypothetical protein
MHKRSVDPLVIALDGHYEPMDVSTKLQSPIRERLSRKSASCRQLVEKRVRFLQIALAAPYPVAPEACEAHAGADFSGFCLLPARDYAGAAEIGCCLRR